MEPNTVFDLNWSGMLTTKNISEVSELLLELLKDKKFTVEIKKEYQKSKPKIYIGQFLILSDEADELVHHEKETWTRMTVLEFRTIDLTFNILTSIDEVPENSESLFPFNTALIEFKPNQVLFTQYGNDEDDVCYYTFTLEE